MVLSICYPVFRFSAKRVAISFPSIVYLHLLLPFPCCSLVYQLQSESSRLHYRSVTVTLKYHYVSWGVLPAGSSGSMWSNSRSLVSSHLLVVHGKRQPDVLLSSPCLLIPPVRKMHEDASTVWLQLLCTSSSSVSNLPKTWGNKLRGSHSAGDEYVCKVTNCSSTSSASGFADGNRVEQTSCSLFLSTSLCYQQTIADVK